MKDSLVNVKNPQGTAILIANFDLKTLILLFLLCKKEH